MMSKSPPRETRSWPQKLSEGSEEDAGSLMMEKGGGGGGYSRAISVVFL
jgi:hypothetical protein